MSSSFDRLRTSGSRLALFGPVTAADLHVAIVAGPEDADAPRVAAHLAVLHEAPAHVGLEINLDLLAAIRAYHLELIIHLSIMDRSRRSVANLSSPFPSEKKWA
jgi:hypothetical protein